MDIKDAITPLDNVAAGLIANTAIVEHFQAPPLTYAFECFGPKEDRREEYLQLLAEAELAESTGAFEKASAVRRYADKMIEKKWEDVAHNLVTNEGRNDILTKYFKGSSYTAAWYLGLKGAGSAAAGDTLASHAGWTEGTPYSGNRPAITWGSVSSQSLSASSAVSYSINATATVAGAFISSVNTGTSGILYSAGDFAASRSVANGDTLNVTPTVTS